MTCSKLVFDSTTGRVICEDTGEVVAEDLIENEHYPFYRRAESVERFKTKPKQIHVSRFTDATEGSAVKDLARAIKRIAKEQGLPQNVCDEAIALMKSYVEMVGGLGSIGSHKLLAKAFLKVAMLRQNMLPFNIDRENRRRLHRLVNRIIEVMNLKPALEFSKEKRVMSAIDYLVKELNLPTSVYMKALDIARKNMYVTAYGPNAYKTLAGVSVYYAACLNDHKVFMSNVMNLLYAGTNKGSPTNQKVRWKTFLSLSDDERIKVLKCLRILTRNGTIWTKFALPKEKVQELHKVAGQSKEEIAKFIVSNLDSVDISKVGVVKKKWRNVDEINVRFPYKDFIKLKELEVKRHGISKDTILLYMINEAMKKLKTEQESITNSL